MGACDGWVGGMAGAGSVGCATGDSTIGVGAGMGVSGAAALPPSDTVPLAGGGDVLAALGIVQPVSSVMQSKQ